MSEPIDLSAVPSRFLNPKERAKLRAFAPNDLLALTYINAPYPDEENPGDFFWDRDGSIKDAIRCYNIGRSLLRHCRTLLSEGKLVATGLNSAGRRQTISSREWLNLWPMFATNKAAGRGQVFDEVKVFEASVSDTAHAQVSAACFTWLNERKTTRSGEKKSVLYDDARKALDCRLTHAIFVPLISLYSVGDVAGHGKTQRTHSDKIDDFSHLFFSLDPGETFAADSLAGEPFVSAHLLVRAAKVDVKVRSHSKFYRRARHQIRPNRRATSKQQ